MEHLLKRYETNRSKVKQLEDEGEISDTAGKILLAIADHDGYNLEDSDDLENATTLLEEITDILRKDIGAYI